MSHALKTTLKYGALLTAGLVLFCVAPELAIFSLFMASIFALSHYTSNTNGFWLRRTVGVDQYYPRNTPVVYTTTPPMRPFSPPFNPHWNHQPVHHHPSTAQVHRHPHASPRSEDRQHRHPSTIVVLT